MGAFRISYNGKDIDLPKGPAKHSLEVNVLQPLVTGPQVFRSGAVLRELEPRVDIRFMCSFPNLSPEHYSGSLASARRLRIQLENFWIYLQRSAGTVSLALDSDLAVNTATSASADSGDSSIAVLSTIGLAARRYRLIGSSAQGQANHYQMLDVSAVAGNVLTLRYSLDYPFDSGAHLIDEHYFPSVVLRDARPGWPFNDHGQREGWFDFQLDVFLGALS